MAEKIYLSWEESRLLIEELDKDTKHLDTNTSAVIGISRGGLVPAVLLSHLKEISHFFTVGVKSYAGEDKKEEIIYQLPPESVLKNIKTVYLVDDICDTGKTLKLLKEKILNYNVVTCSMVYRTNETYKPDFSGVEISDDRWVVFPWEKTK